MKLSLLIPDNYREKVNSPLAKTMKLSLLGFQTICLLAFSKDNEAVTADS
jgi:hypothetical protein